MQATQDAMCSRVGYGIGLNAACLDDHVGCAARTHGDFVVARAAALVIAGHQKDVDRRVVADGPRELVPWRRIKEARVTETLDGAATEQEQQHSQCCVATPSPSLTP